MAQPNETARLEDLPDAVQDLVIGGGNRFRIRSPQRLFPGGNVKQLLEVDSLVYTEGDKAGINLEVMAAYLKHDLRLLNHCVHFAFATLEDVNLALYALEVKSAFLTSAHLAYVAYQDGLQWRLMIARHGRPTMLYDPCLATRYKISKKAMELSKLLNPSYQIMSWPHQANTIDSGPLVILAIQKHVNMVKPTQRMINADVSRFRGPALRKLAERFKLTVDGQPYTLPTIAAEQVVLQKPKLNVQLLTERKARIDADIMYAYMNFLMEEVSMHSFRVIEKPDLVNPAQLYEEIVVEFTNSATKYFYVAYHQTKRWRLIVIHKEGTFRHFDPADPNPDGGVVSQFALDLMKCLSDGLKLRRFEDPQWPCTKDRADSGAYVLMAVSFHRDLPTHKWQVIDDVANEFRRIITVQLEYDYELTAFGKPYTLPAKPAPAPIAKPEEEPKDN